MRGSTKKLVGAGLGATLGMALAACPKVERAPSYTPQPLSSHEKAIAIAQRILYLYGHATSPSMRASSQPESAVSVTLTTAEQFTVSLVASFEQPGPDDSAEDPDPDTVTTLLFTADRGNSKVRIGLAKEGRSSNWETHWLHELPGGSISTYVSQYKDTVTTQADTKPYQSPRIAQCVEDETFHQAVELASLTNGIAMPQLAPPPLTADCP